MNIIRRFMENLTRQIACKLHHQLDKKVNPLSFTDGIVRMLLINLSMHYKELIRNNIPIPSFSEVEFSLYSQNGEDGILLLIFAVIGVSNQCVVEICAGDGTECNAANLIINHGWKGLLVDSNGEAIERGKSFYAQRTNAWRFRRLPPCFIKAWVTKENVNDLIQENGMSGEIDLLSLDLDGIDFWVWKEITCINPRVVIVEFNNRWNSQQSVTVPYSDGFVGFEASTNGIGYFGASLLAFNHLAQQKGYRLIGVNSPNTNAFFMRNDIGIDYFHEVSVESCLNSEYAIHQHNQWCQLLMEYPVVEI